MKWLGRLLKHVPDAAAVYIAFARGGHEEARRSLDRRWERTKERQRARLDRLRASDEERR